MAVGRRGDFEGRPAIARFDPFAGAPRLHGAARVGIRPGTELVHALAATGERPLRFDVRGLPEGITVDDEGILRGIAPNERGDVPLHVRVWNDLGVASAEVTLVVGDQLALTPPMGWNSWNVYGSAITADIVVGVAEAMVATGMRDLGYQYVNIDDHWHAAERNPDGTPAANPETFPDGIGAVADRVHALGLKLGIYSDAGSMTCGRCFGGYGYEDVDANAYADWGVDLLKYDYCYAPPTPAQARARYGTMSRALEQAGRSIVLSVCEWGFRRPWRWAAELGGAYWRTTPDIFDTFSWTILGVRGIARKNLALAEHAGPGRWNDPDMLLVGNRGKGGVTKELRLPFRVLGRQPVVARFGGLDDEQARTHVTLWAMMASPLLASHDLSASDPYDLALLTNPEILAIDQDPLGVQARRLPGPRGVWVLAKPLADGGIAVSFTNTTRVARQASVDLRPLVPGRDLEVVDAWTHEHLGRSPVLEARLARHASAAFVCRPQ